MSIDAIAPNLCFVSRKVTGINGWLPLTGGSWRKSAKILCLCRQKVGVRT